MKERHVIERDIIWSSLAQTRRRRSCEIQHGMGDNHAFGRARGAGRIHQQALIFETLRMVIIDRIGICQSRFIFAHAAHAVRIDPVLDTGQRLSGFRQRRKGHIDKHH